MAMSKEKASRFKEAMAEQIARNSSRIDEREAELEEKKSAMFEKVAVEEAGDNQKMFSDLFFDPSLIDAPDFAVDTFHHMHKDWPEWVVAAVPERDPNYQQNREVLYAFVVADDEHAFLVGEPGSGKTSLPFYVASITGRPVFKQPFRNNMEEDDWVMSKEIDDTGTHWNVLPFVKWLPYPCYAVLDEFNRLQRGGRILMNQLLNEGGSLSLRDGTEVVPHERWRAIATDNARGLGDGLDKFDGDIADISTLDRFGVMEYVPYLPHDQQVDLLQAWYPEMVDEMANDIVTFGEKVITGYKSGTFPLPWTPRRMQKAGKMALRYRNPVNGLKQAYYNFLAEDAERQAANQILKDIGLARKFGEFE
jgi:hypothetical protein